MGLDTRGSHILTSWEIQILAFIVPPTKSHKDNKLRTLQSIKLLLVNTYIFHDMWPTSCMNYATQFNLHISYITPPTCNVNNIDLIHWTHSLSEHKWHIAHNSHHVNTSHHFTNFDNMNWIPIPLIPHVHKTMIVIIIITQVFSSRRSLINPCSHLHKHGGNKVDTQTLISSPLQMNCHSFSNCQIVTIHHVMLFHVYS